MRWGPVPAAQTTEAQTRLNQLTLGERLRIHDEASSSGPYWVYYPPLKDKSSADAQLAKWQALGIRDLGIIRNGPWQNALSFGVYGKHDAALQRTAALLKAGIHAQVEARQSAGRVFTLLHTDASERAALQAIARDMKLAPAVPAECPAP